MENKFEIIINKINDSKINNNYGYKLDHNLNHMILDYYNYLCTTTNFNSSSNRDYIFSLIELLDLKSEILRYINDKKDSFYNYNRKELSINIEELISAYKLNILTKENLIIEYLTILFHEIFHAKQFQELNNNHSFNTLIKEFSLECKRIKKLDNILHDLIPDEREASIESAKLLYLFSLNNKLDNRNFELNYCYYLINGYLNIGDQQIFPFKSISKFIEYPILNKINVSYLLENFIYGLTTTDFIDINYIRHKNTLNDDIKIKLKTNIMKGGEYNGK